MQLCIRKSRSQQSYIPAESRYDKSCCHALSTVKGAAGFGLFWETVTGRRVSAVTTPLLVARTFLYGYGRMTGSLKLGSSATLRAHWRSWMFGVPAVVARVVSGSHGSSPSTGRTRVCRTCGIGSPRTVRVTTVASMSGVTCTFRSLPVGPRRRVSLDYASRGGRSRTQPAAPAMCLPLPCGRRRTPSWNVVERRQHGDPGHGFVADVKWGLARWRMSDRTLHRARPRSVC